MAWWSSYGSYGSRSKSSWTWKRPTYKKWPMEKMEDGWDCQICATNNWWSRHSCRGGCDAGSPQCSSSWNMNNMADTGEGMPTWIPPPSMAGDPKVVAAAKVIKLEEAIARLSDDPILAMAKLELERELQKQQKLAKDTRSTAKKIDQKQGWIEREVKRVEVETKHLAEQQKSLEERQKQLQMEIVELAKLKLELTTEAAADDAEEDELMEITPEQVAELRKMEERELRIRRNIGRKRKPEEDADASSEEMGQWAEEADAISAQIGKKRQELAKAVEGKRRKE